MAVWPKPLSPTKKTAQPLYAEYTWWYSDKQYTNASGRHCKKQLQFISAYPINSGKKILQLCFGYIQDSLWLILSMPQVQYIVQKHWLYLVGMSLLFNSLTAIFSNSCYSTIFEVQTAVEV